MNCRARTFGSSAITTLPWGQFFFLGDFTVVRFAVYSHWQLRTYIIMCSIFVVMAIHSHFTRKQKQFEIKWALIFHFIYTIRTTMRPSTLHRVFFFLFLLLSFLTTNNNIHGWCVWWTGQYFVYWIAKEVNTKGDLSFTTVINKNRTEKKNKYNQKRNKNVRWVMFSVLIIRFL